MRHNAPGQEQGGPCRATFQVTYALFNSAQIPLALEQGRDIESLEA